MNIARKKIGSRNRKRANPNLLSAIVDYVGSTGVDQYLIEIAPPRNSSVRRLEYGSI
jgi:hypothetical protein